MAVEDEFWFRFWGVRGSIACSGPDMVRYGGNTSCLEVRCGSHRLIFDAGTGLRPLGVDMAGEPGMEIDLFFSHTHLDHIVGLPFFVPLFQPRNRLRLWAGHLQPQGLTLRKVLSDLMTAPLFPVPPEVFNADVTYVDFAHGDVLDPWPGVRLRTAALNHPNGATGYRIEYGGRSLCYVTDTEHVPGHPDANVLSLIAGADFVIYDSTYTDAEFPRYITWGHSTWEEGVRLAETAGVGTLVIFHHDPGKDDRALDAVAEAADALRPGTLVAREGVVIRV